MGFGGKAPDKQFITLIPSETHSRPLHTLHKNHKNLLKYYALCLLTFIYIYGILYKIEIKQAYGDSGTLGVVQTCPCDPRVGRPFS